MEYKNALISVFDKEKIVDFAKELKKLGVNIISSGGTSKVLRNSGIKIQEVSELSGFPEMLDGRVKTLHPIIHAGILARRKNKEHMNILKKHKINTIDIVVCNLYPFEKTIKKTNVSQEEVIENIDIGGPTLIRAAAKNFEDVVILTNPNQYDEILMQPNILNSHIFCIYLPSNQLIFFYISFRWNTTHCNIEAFTFYCFINLL